MCSIKTVTHSLGMTSNGVDLIFGIFTSESERMLTGTRSLTTQ